MILLDNRVDDQISTRRLRVVKYRGSAHGTNEYPFLIDEQGISVLPVTSAGLGYEVSDEIRARPASPGLDAMLGAGRLLPRLQHPDLRHGRDGQDQHRRALRRRRLRARASAASTSPSRRAASRSAATCARSGSTCSGTSRAACCGSRRRARACSGWRCIWRGCTATSSSSSRRVVVIDPISALRGPSSEVQATLLRMVDMLKGRGITAVFTSLRTDGDLRARPTISASPR